MTPHAWFTLVLRGFGVWEALSAIDTAGSVFNLARGFVRLERSVPQSFMTHAIISLVLAGWLLFKAPQIASLFYPAAPKPPEK